MSAESLIRDLQERDAEKAKEALRGKRILDVHYVERLDGRLSGSFSANRCVTHKTERSARPFREELAPGSSRSIRDQFCRRFHG